jgi:hypothetical protein
VVAGLAGVIAELASGARRADEYTALH